MSRVLRAQAQINNTPDMCHRIQCTYLLACVCQCVCVCVNMYRYSYYSMSNRSPHARPYSSILNCLLLAGNGSVIYCNTFTHLCREMASQIRKVCIDPCPTSGLGHCEPQTGKALRAHSVQHPTPAPAQPPSPSPSPPQQHKPQKSLYHFVVAAAGSVLMLCAVV